MRAGQDDRLKRAGAYISRDYFTTRFKYDKAPSRGALCITLPFLYGSAGNGATSGQTMSLIFHWVVLYT